MYEEKEITIDIVQGCEPLTLASLLENFRSLKIFEEAEKINKGRQERPSKVTSLSVSNSPFLGNYFL